MAKKSKRRRATALVVNDGKVLLVRHRGESHYSLPGGGIEKGETSLEAAVREVREETQLRATYAKRLFRCDVDGQMAQHKVTEIRASGKVKLQGREIAESLWWNGRTRIKANGHVYAITKSAKVFQRN